MSKKRDKEIVKKTHVILLWMTLILVVDLMVGTLITKSFIYILLSIIYFLLYLCYSFYISIKEVVDMWKNEPFGAFTNLLAVILIGIPILFVSVNNQNILADSIKSFYAVAVGIGINYIIDSVIKFVEPEIQNDKEKKLMTKKGAFTKILFNAIYISEYATFVLLEQINLDLFKPLKKCDFLYTIFEWLSKQSNWVKIFSLTIVLFVILMGLAIVSMELIRKELKNEMTNETDILKNEIKNDIKEELSTILEFKKSIMRINEDIINGITQSHNQLQEELQKLDIKKR